MQKVKITLIMACAVAVFGCKKEITPSVMNWQPNAAMVDSVPTSQEDKELVTNLGKLTRVLQELYLDNSNLKIVNASIFAKAYTDESILVKDLIYPDQSRLNDNVRFKNYMQKWNLSLERFAENFWKEVSKSSDQNFRRFLNGLEGTNSLNGVDKDRPSPGRVSSFGDEVSIYFPYSEERLPDENGTYAPIITLVTATADADQGLGYQPYYVGGVFQSYREVVVDDDYAENNPTQIIGVNGIEPYYPPVATNSAFPPGAPIDLPDLVREVKQVYVGEIRVNNHQFDKLISFTGNGGGSEIRFTRADGFLKVEDGQVITANVYFTPVKDVSRYNVKNSILVDASFEWDGDWERDNIQENLAIYEEDNRNSSTFTGSLTTTITASLTPITVTAARTLGFIINFKSDDDLIRQVNFNRDAFFVLNRTDLEGEMSQGWPVRDKRGTVSYTLNDRTYY